MAAVRNRRRVLSWIFLLLLLPGGVPPASASEGGEAPPVRKGWLERHQSPDGSWDPVRFDARCEKPPLCFGRGRAEDRVGTTALPLLTYLAYGETHETPRYGAVVKRGFRWLLDGQDGAGGFPPFEGERVLLNHARAAFALSQIFRVTKAAEFRGPAQKALDWLLSRRSEKGGWPSSPGGKETDLEASAWAALAIEAAGKAGLETGKEPFGAFAAWLEAGTDRETGRFGPAPNRDVKAGKEEGGRFLPERATALAVLSRMAMGGRAEDPPIARGIETLLRCLPPVVDEVKEPDLTFALFSSLACSRAGGKAWDRWALAVKRMVIDNQRLARDPCDYGSWEPRGPSAGEGRVGCTSLGVQCLVIYYGKAR